MKAALSDKEAREYLGVTERVWKRAKLMGLVRPVPVLNVYPVFQLDNLLQSLCASGQVENGGRQEDICGRSNGSYRPRKVGRKAQVHPLD